MNFFLEQEWNISAMEKIVWKQYGNDGDREDGGKKMVEIERNVVMVMKR